MRCFAIYVVLRFEFCNKVGIIKIGIPDSAHILAAEHSDQHHSCSSRTCYKGPIVLLEYESTLSSLRFQLVSRNVGSEFCSTVPGEKCTTVNDCKHNYKLYFYNKGRKRVL